VRQITERPNSRAADRGPEVANRRSRRTFPRKVRFRFRIVVKHRKILNGHFTSTEIGQKLKSSEFYLQ
jgi:hypothetical protein